MSSHERQRACLQCPAALRAWESGGGVGAVRKRGFYRREVGDRLQNPGEKKKKKTLEKTEFQVKELKCIQQPMESLKMFTQDYEIPKSV